MEQQAEASTLGMWVFLVTEIMFFGGLFMAYLVYRHAVPGRRSRRPAIELNRVWGAINTVVLICSSLTMALAVRAAQTSATRKTQVGWLVADDGPRRRRSSASRRSSTPTSSCTITCPGPHFHWDGQYPQAAPRSSTRSTSR